MPRARVYPAEAIVLSSAPFGEADLLVTLLTAERGKVRAVGKGARRPKSRLSGHLEPLAHLRVLLAEGKSLDVVAQAQMATAFIPLREELGRAAAGLYAAEVAGCFASEGVAAETLFGFLWETLDRIARVRDPWLALRFFEMRLLVEGGFQPELRHCVACGSELQPVVSFFTASGGGVLCAACRYRGGRTRPLTVTAVKVLRALQREPWAGIADVHVPQDVGAEVEFLLREYLVYTLEREIRSTEFLDRLRRELVAETAVVERSP